MSKKKVHLIANAHIDPIWLWDWVSGASATVSTFQSALNLLGEYDYVFNHNEAMIYKYIEEYAPELFKQIQEAVKDKKWNIMGGWYLQPDCVMPSGESLVRQIRLGQKYFKEKFGVVPTTAINFDPFGHTRGLVQIIKKCGQDSYMIMRPHDQPFDLTENEFMWEGFDGSEIKVTRISCYSTIFGEAAEKIKGDVQNQPYDVVASNWGVGNHGGGPSRVDLQKIGEYIKSAAEEGIEIVHSSPDKFFSEIEPSFRYNKSLYIAFPGCYTSMSRLKRFHIALENRLWFTEKICSIAAMNTSFEYPHDKINNITLDLLTCEFHDVLPGTSIRAGEENAFNMLREGLIQCERIIAAAFFALLTAEKPGGEGETPVFVFNPHPYEIDSNVECEFSLYPRNINREIFSKITILDADGNELDTQVVKEESTLNHLDWMKKAVFSAKLKPMALNRFMVKVEFVPREFNLKEEYVYSDSEKYVEIDKTTGLLKSFKVGGKEYIHDAFCPVMFNDNEDPWGMTKKCDKSVDYRGFLYRKAEETILGDNPEPFELCKNPDGVFGDLKSIEVIENGKIYLAIEAFFEKDHSKIRVEYKIYKNKPYLDVNVDVFWQDINKMLRLAIPLNEEGKLIGQTAFGTDELFMNGKENISHRFIALQNGDDCFAVFNNSTYGSTYRDKTLYLSLLRGTSYATHPCSFGSLVPENRFIKRADQGEHNYSFRIAVAKRNELEKMAQEFNQKPYVQSAFPVKADYRKNENPKSVVIENSNIALITFKAADNGDGYIVRLMNNSPETAKTVMRIGEEKIELAFGKYEAKTVRYNGKFEELDSLEI